MHDLNESTRAETDGFARSMWWHLEMIHAVTYFAPESRQAAEALGLRGFWRSYFGFRAAPLGRCSAGVVEAAFFGFAPAMVRQAIPDVWDRADPTALLAARASSASSALRRVAPSIDRVSLAPVVARLHECAMAPGSAGGRPLFAANRDVAVVDGHDGHDGLGDPVTRLWQSCTTLREHRGDGHIAAWVANGLSAPEVAVLFVSDTAIPDDVLQSNRGWTDAEWSAARDSLVSRGLLVGGGVTPAGQAARAAVEQTTNRLAAERFSGLSADERRVMLDVLGEPTAEIAASGLIPFPNPMGLPPSD